MTRIKKFKLLWAIFGIVVAGFVFFDIVPNAFAQETGVAQGLSFFSDSGLSNTDPRVIVARLVQGFLMILGTIFVVLIVYAGYLWMTSGGNEEQTGKSLSIMRNAAIGLTIILLSFSIATFVINLLLEAVGFRQQPWCQDAQDIGKTQGCYVCVDDGNGSVSPEEDPNACDEALTRLQKVSSVPPHAPSNETYTPQWIRNTVIRMTLNKDIDSKTLVPNDIVVCPVVKNIGPDQTPEDISADCLANRLTPSEVTVQGNQIFWHASGECGADTDNDGTDDSVCFDEWKRYRVDMTSARNSLKSSAASGSQAFYCSGDPAFTSASCLFEFNVNNIIDTDEPKILEVTFEPALQGGKYLPADWPDDINATFLGKDSNGVSQISYSIEGITDGAYRVPESGEKVIPRNDTFPELFSWYDALPTPDWSTAGFSAEDRFVIRARAYDIDNHQSTLFSKEIELRASHCFNQVLDSDETGLDCGGNDCGICDGDICGNIDTETKICSLPQNEACVSNFCDPASCRCGQRPVIMDIQPRSGRAGTWVTVRGKGFGESAGKVEFIYRYQDSVNEAYTVAGSLDPAMCGDTWSESQIIVSAPRLRDITGNTLTDEQLLNEIAYVKVTDARGLFDISDADQYGNYDSSYEYTNAAHPGLCRVYPAGHSDQAAAGVVEDAMTGRGQGFTDTNDLASRAVIFGGDIEAPRSDTTWTSDTSVNFSVPNIKPQQTSVQVELTGRDGVRAKSNPVDFTVQKESSEKAPIISDVLSPDEENPDFESSKYLGWGARKQVITIVGSNFSDEQGAVYFENTDGSGDSGMGTLSDLPRECLVKSWSNTKIVIRVPENYTAGSVREGLHSVWVQTGGEKNLESNRVGFEVRNDDELRPGLCLLDPDNGPANGTLPVTAYGDGFGTSKGSLVFTQEISASVTAWSQSVIQSLVPSGAKSGSVYVKTSAKKASNPLSYSVSDCRIEKDGFCGENICCGDGSCRADCTETSTNKDYVGWAFSTGKFPESFHVLKQCRQVLAAFASPSPSSNYPDGNNVCINTRAQALFNLSLTPESVSPGQFIVEKCSEDENGNAVNCSSDGVLTEEPEDIFGIDEKDADGVYGVYLLSANSNNDWLKDTWYKVTLKNTILDESASQSLDGNEDGVGCYAFYNFDSKKDCSEDDFSWFFKTGSDRCELSKVALTPSESTITEAGGQMSYSASAFTSEDLCVSLSGGDIQYAWDSSNTGIATLDSAMTSAKKEKNIATAKDKQGDTTIAADGAQDLDGNETYEHEPSAENQGRAILHVKFISPELVSRWPQCSAACVNAEVGMEWNAKIGAFFINNPANTQFFKLFSFTCGNGMVEAGESCDDGNRDESDGCDLLCRSTGSNSCSSAGADPKFCCGNNRVDHPNNEAAQGGEQCDGVSAFKEGYCDPKNCLLIPRCQGGVQNGQVNPGEECDEGVAGGTATCSSSCKNLSGARLKEIPVSVESADQKTIVLRPTEKDPSNPPLTPHTSYCVAVSRSVKSQSNVPVYEKQTPAWNDADCAAEISSLLSTNAFFKNPSPLAWSFRTKDDSSLCAVADVSLNPASGKVNVLGDEVRSRISYRATPLGSPDECNPNEGQKLNASLYDWEWSTEDTKVAVVVDGGVDQAPLCGNGVREFGEDGDYGQCFEKNNTPLNMICASADECGKSSDGTSRVCVLPTSASNQFLTQQCTHKGTPKCSETLKQNCCGDGKRDFAEDCDDGNVSDGDGCSPACTTIGFAATCGNGKIDAGVNFAEECDDGNRVSNDGCSSLCVNEGTREDGKIDPVQQVEGVGMRESDRDAGQSTTHVFAEESLSTRLGAANFTVMCGYTSDADCDALTPKTSGDIGLGSDSCCYAKPKVSVTSPNGNGVCRNAVVMAGFDQEMNTATFQTGSYLVGKFFGTCPDGYAKVAFENQSSSSNLWSRFSVWLKDIFYSWFGREGNAAEPISCMIPGKFTSLDAKTLIFSPQQIFAENTAYTLVLQTTGIASVRNTLGVALAPNTSDGTYRFSFSTGAVMCEIDEVEIKVNPYDITNPSSGVKVKDYDFFNCTNVNDPAACKDDVIATLAGTQHEYQAFARNILRPDDILNASYSWIKDASFADKYTLRNQGDARPAETGSKQQINITPERENFDTFVTVSAVSKDFGYCKNDPKRSCVLSAPVCAESAPCIPNQASRDFPLYAFMCENPWPSLKELPPFTGNKSPYFYSFLYCRDNGADGVADDLPSLSAVKTPVLGAEKNQSDPLVEEYVLKVVSPGYCKSKGSGSKEGCGACAPGDACIQHHYCSKSNLACDPLNENACAEGESCLPPQDAIGFRIFENASHASPQDWFRKKNLNGNMSIAPLVDGWQAGRVGNTTYIDAAYGDPALFSSTGMFVFSASEKASQDTLNIYGQILNNARFGTRYTNKKLCSDGKTCSYDFECANFLSGGRCDAVKDKVRRDTVRLADLNFMNQRAATYRSDKSTYPILSSGTYLQGQSMSVWPSWQETLSETLNENDGLGSLPLDPINRLFGCGAPYDEKTCWDEQSLKLACPAYSWSYGYHFDTANQATFYAKLEQEQDWFPGQIANQPPQYCTEDTFSVSQTDSDLDAIPNDSDNCPLVANGNQCDKFPSRCDVNGDKNTDGVFDDVVVRALEGKNSDDPAALDNEKDLGLQKDTDRDGVGDACDACWKDDGSNTGTDEDQDGFCSAKDNCPNVANPDQADWDKDRVGDVCDSDADNDGYEVQNDCSDKETLDICKSGFDPLDLRISLVEQDEGSIANFGMWIFESDAFFKAKIKSQPEQDEARPDFFLKREYASVVNLNYLPSGRYTMRVRSKVSAGDKNDARYQHRFGKNMKIVGGGVNFYSSASGTCKTQGTLDINRTDDITLGNGVLCYGTPDPNYGNMSGYIDYLFDVNNPEVYSMCSVLVNPGAVEVCDTVDNDCDGLSDVIPYYACSVSGTSCSLSNPTSCPANEACVLKRFFDVCSPDEDHDRYTVADGDCDDTNSDVYPDTRGETHGLESSNKNSANALCKDTKDNDCDGKTDWRDVPECTDADHDQWAVLGGVGDCADDNPNANPDIPEDCDDLVDNDCNGNFDLADTAHCKAGLSVKPWVYLCDDTANGRDDQFEILLSSYASGTEPSKLLIALAEETAEQCRVYHLYDPLQGYADKASDPIVSGRYRMRIRSSGTNSDLSLDPYGIFYAGLYPMKVIKIEDVFVSGEQIAPESLLIPNYCAKGSIPKTDLYALIKTQNHESGYGMISGPLCAAEKFNARIGTGTSKEQKAGYVDLVVDIHAPGIVEEK